MGLSVSSLIATDLGSNSMKSVEQECEYNSAIFSYQEQP